MRTGKVDFHLHSYASNVTDYYAANAFSIPESYSDPLKLYDLLKERGMSLVTLTDHNSIDGVLEMLAAGREDVFISAEMTTTFPEDGCNIHVTIANMKEAQFKEAMRLRGNVYEMIAYVDSLIAAEKAGDNKLAYFMTHPLMSTQNRPYGREGALTIEHIEKALLLCNCFEVQNGTRTRSLNDMTLRILESLDAQIIERLANKHDREPKGPTPWLKAIVGGSDDHCGINPGRTWTLFDGTTPNALIDAMRRRQTQPQGMHGGPVTLAHALLKLMYDGNSPRNRTQKKKVVTIGGPIETLLQLVFDAKSDPLYRRVAARAKLALSHLERDLPVGAPFEKVFAAEARALLADRAFRARLVGLERTDDRIFLVVSTLINRIFVRYLTNVAEQGSFNIVGTIKELVALVTSNIFVSLPYLSAYSAQSSERLIVRDARKAFELHEAPRLVLVTDTLFEVNGVTRTIRRMMREAEARGVDFTVVTCLSEEEFRIYGAQPEIQRYLNNGRLKIFTSVKNLDFPEYDGLQIRFAPFLDLLKYLQEGGFTKMQISTPGTVGAAGLIAAKMLQIETAATYHTSFPEYVENYTKDYSLEALAWRYMILFYHSVDEVLVPSKFIARLLHKRGLRNRKLLILDRWVDLDRFHPKKRVLGYLSRFGVRHGVVTFIYVGRLGVEKNLDLLVDAYRSLCELRDDVHLLLVGDGPHRKALEEKLFGLPASFAGVLEGEALSVTIASADVKVFPSTTDTWGNAPLEAQASGLPVIVSDVGGPAELMQDGVTGFRVPGRDAKAFAAIMGALCDVKLRREMGFNARAFVEAHDVEAPFTAVFDSDAYRARLAAQKAAAASSEELPFDLGANPEVNA